jgi:hypothetical protein
MAAPRASAPRTTDRETRPAASAHRTGPRTPAGKAAASRNAITHGLLSEDPIATPAEQPAAWHLHCHSVLESLEPSGYLETVLAERIALLHWRLARVARHETALIARDHVQLAAEHAERRYVCPDGRPSTEADLEAERRRRDRRWSILRCTATLDPDAALTAEDARDLLQALLAPYKNPAAALTLLRDARPTDDPTAYCARRRWTLADLHAAFAPLLARGHSTLAALREDALRHAEKECAALTRARSDEEIALTVAAHTLPDLAALERLARYEAHISRELARATHELDRLQTLRRAAQRDENCETNPAPVAGTDPQTGRPAPSARQNGSPVPPAQAGTNENCETNAAPALASPVSHPLSCSAGQVDDDGARPAPVTGYGCRQPLARLANPPAGMFSSRTAPNLHAQDPAGHSLGPLTAQVGATPFRTLQSQTVPIVAGRGPALARAILPAPALAAPFAGGLS